MCPTQERLHEFHAFELSEAECAEIESHLSSCPACARLDAELLRQQERIAGMVREMSQRSSAGFDSGTGGDEPAIQAAARAASHYAGQVPSIAGYEILHEVHHGGQGVVFEAIQKSTRRRVAIKVMRDGPLAHPRDYVRFEREVRILGRLRHPNIVTVLDSGLAGGLFYSVMDFVPGRALDEYISNPPSLPPGKGGNSAGAGLGPTASAMGSDECAAPRGLPLRQRLELFVTICEAVGAAHLVGVIHRDLKPGNIRIDDDGRPFILDFGLAKANDAMLDLTGGTPAPHQRSAPHSLTHTGQFLGSLPWASPEQARGDTELDLRTDVYSLGVVIYQALTGRFPYPIAGPPGEVFHNICHIEPLPPSRAVRMRGDKPGGSLTEHGDEPRGSLIEHGNKPRGSLRATPLSQKVGGLDDDIDAIVLRCLSKERERRYSSAGELARDLRRYLAGEPIEARRDSAFYVLRKRLRRHKAVASLSLLLTLSLAGLSVTMAVQSRRVARSRDEAVRERDRARAAEQRADREAERLARTAYIGQITLAQREFDASAIAEMRRVLDQTDPQLRGWEWYRLNWLADRSARVLAAVDISTRALLTREGHAIWGTRNGRIFCRDLHTDRLIYTKVIDGSGVSTLALSEDQESLYAGTQRGRFTLHARSGRLLGESCDHGVRSLCPWPGDRSKLLEISAWPDVNVSLVDVDIGATLFSRDWDYEWGNTIFSGDPPILACSPDGKQFAAAIDAAALLFTRAGRHSRSYSEPEKRVDALAYSPDGTHLALAAGEGLVRLWDRRGHQPVKTLVGHTSQVTALQYSRDAMRLLSGDSRGCIRLWDVHSGQCLKVFHGHLAGVISVAFAQDETFVLSGSEDETVRLWDTAACDVNHTVAGPGSRYASFSPDFTGVAVLDRDQLSVCDINGRELQKFRGQEEGTVCGFLSDGQRAYFADTLGQMRVWDLQTESLIATLSHDAGVSAAACSSDGRYLITASWDATCRVWRAGDLSLHRVLRHSDEVWDLAVSPDSRLLATGARDGIARLWDLDTGRKLRAWPGHAAAIDALAFTPRGDRLSVGCSDGLVRIYNPATGEKTAEWRSPHGHLYSAAFTPDARRLLLGASQHVEVWDPHAGELVYSFPAHEGSIYALQLSPDATLLLTAARDTAFKLWPAARSK